MKCRKNLNLKETIGLVPSASQGVPCSFALHFSIHFILYSLKHNVAIGKVVPFIFRFTLHCSHEMLTIGRPVEEWVNPATLMFRTPSWRSAGQITGSCTHWPLFARYSSHNSPRGEADLLMPLGFCNNDTILEKFCTIFSIHYSIYNSSDDL